jgi:hypothetical protein
MAKCCICNEEKKENLRILGSYICSDCEWKILTNHAHTNGYTHTVNKLKTLFTAK